MTLEGYERISIRWLGPLSPIVEQLLLKRRFEAVCEYGWRRLRKMDKAGESERFHNFR